MSEGQRFDAIVVGAGHNGLVASWYLAEAGLDVIVLDGRERVGGLCSTGEIVPGYRGNLGTNNAHSLENRIVEDMVRLWVGRDGAGRAGVSRTGPQASCRSCAQACCRKPFCPGWRFGEKPFLARVSSTLW